MEIVLIRHGEPNYKPCEERGFVGHGQDLAPLTQLGVKQAEAVAADSRLNNCEIILASPYTRALQTAAIISRITNVPIEVEIDLHEGIPDLSFTYKSVEERKKLQEDFVANKGVYPNGEKRDWEDIPSLVKRLDSVLKRAYNRGYNKIMIVAHGGIIRRFTGDYNVEFCTPYISQYNGGFDYHNWV